MSHLANAPGSIAARGTRAGRSGAQEWLARGGAGCDLGPRAGHGRGREADGREGSTQDHTRRQGLVGQVWCEQGWKLFVIEMKPLTLFMLPLTQIELSYCLIFVISNICSFVEFIQYGVARTHASLIELNQLMGRARTSLSTELPALNSLRYIRCSTK